MPPPHSASPSIRAQAQSIDVRIKHAAYTGNSAQDQRTMEAKGPANDGSRLRRRGSTNSPITGRRLRPGQYITASSGGGATADTKADAKADAKAEAGSGRRRGQGGGGAKAKAGGQGRRRGWRPRPEAGPETGPRRRRRRPRPEAKAGGQGRRPRPEAGGQGQGGGGAKAKAKAKGRGGQRSETRIWSALVSEMISSSLLYSPPVSCDQLHAWA